MFAAPPEQSLEWSDEGVEGAHRFLKRNHAALEKLPVAIFSLGPTHGEDPIPTVQPQMDKELAKYPWLKPVSTELFGGEYDPDKLRSAAVIAPDFSSVRFGAVAPAVIAPVSSSPAAQPGPSVSASAQTSPSIPQRQLPDSVL